MEQIIYFARVRRGWTQQQLAQEAGVSRRTVCAIEGGNHLPTLSSCLRLCKALGLEPEEVLPYVSLPELRA